MITLIANCWLIIGSDSIKKPLGDSNETGRCGYATIALASVPQAEREGEGGERALDTPATLNHKRLTR